MKNISLCAVFLATFYFQGCVVPDADAANYWDHYFSLQDALRTQWGGTSELALIFGGANPKTEKKLYPVSGNPNRLRIALNASSSNGWDIQFGESRQIDSPYSIQTTYQKSEFEGRPTYKIKRETIIRSSYQPLHFIREWIALQNFMAENAPESLENQSNLQKFLCTAFECRTSADKNYARVCYQFSGKTKRQFPEFYEKYKGRLERFTLRMRIKASSDPKAKPVLLNTTSDSICLRFSRETIAVPEGDANLSMVSEMEIRFYGIRFWMKRLPYWMHFEKNQINGQFTSMPEYKVEGRFLYVIPTSWIDFFLPEDIEEYARQSLELLVHGSDKKGGTRFVTRLRGSGAMEYIHFISYSETPQKRVKFFGGAPSNDNPKTEPFVEGFEKAIVEDLRK